jgi:dTDP-4-dehydrorhamnose reductase
VIRALVTGCRGQVGTELVRSLEGRAEVIAHDRRSLDLQDPGAIARRVREGRPDLILNAAAYTAVDRAESEPAAAHAVNARAPAVLAEEARRAGALLVHFSTDYVFDGTKPAPYVESDAPNPLNVYGATKLEGELAIAAAGCDHLILRTSWVYGPRGGNFVRTMLKLAAAKPEIRVVDDQRGAPTSSRQLARAVLDLLLAGDLGRAAAAEDLARLRGRSGVYHATASGETTWFEYAQAIFAEHSKRAGPAFTAPRVIAIPTSEFPTPARRPANSRLSCAKLAATFGVTLSDWREGLRETLSAFE